MKRLLLCSILLLCLSFLSGCFSYIDKRVPDLGATMTEPSTDKSPVIMTVFEHEHQMEGNRKDWATSITDSLYRESLTETSKKSPVMKKASETPTEDVNYILFLDTINNEHGQAMAIIGGLSLMILPTFPSVSHIVKASLYEAATNIEVAAFEARTEQETVVWLPLLPFTPLTLALAPGRKELLDPCFNDIFIQIAQVIKDRPLPVAVSPSKIKIKKEPERIKRTIKIDN